VFYANRPAALWVHRVVSAQGCFRPRCVLTFFDSPFLVVFYDPETSFRCCSSSEFLRFVSSPGSPFGPSFTLPLGFLALFATSLRRSHFSQGLPRPRYGPPTGFLNLSTVCSAPKLAGLFHPAATSRISLVQGLLSPRSHPSSSEGACPQVVVPKATHPLAQAATAPGPRLRGLHPREAAFSSPQLFTTQSAAPLFEFFSSRLSHSPRWAPAYPEPSALDVSSRNLRLRVRLETTSPAFSPRGARQSRLRFRPPARGFEPTLRVSDLDRLHPKVTQVMLPFDTQRLRR
jgi:hypothetical protein